MDLHRRSVGLKWRMLDRKIIMIYSTATTRGYKDTPIFFARIMAREKADSCPFEDALKRFTDSNSVKQVPIYSLFLCANVRKVRLFPLVSQNLFIQSNDRARETGLLHVRETSNWYLYPWRGLRVQATIKRSRNAFRVIVTRKHDPAKLRTRRAYVRRWFWKFKRRGKRSKGRN